MPNNLILSRIEKNEIDKIVNRSKKRLKFVLEEEFQYHHLAINRSNVFLRRHDGKKLKMFVLFVDLGKSTIMSSNLKPDDFAKIIRVFSQEMAYVVEHYGGLVLKFVGDALIGYFLLTNMSRKTAIKIACCAYAMNNVIDQSVNPMLQEQQLPSLQIKISADFGENIVVRYGDEKKKSHVDIIGLSINLAAKMQSLGEPSTFVIGETVYQKLPKRLKDCFKKISTNSNKWPYHEINTNKRYPVFLTRV